jgi:hypothetical protein
LTSLLAKLPSPLPLSLALFGEEDKKKATQRAKHECFSLGFFSPLSLLPFLTSWALAFSA